MESTNPLREGLETDRIAPPCTVVIFGASGDLTRRKLVPALYNLALSRLLGPGTAVVGYARKPMSDDAFRTEQKEACAKFSRRKPLDETVWNDFAQGLSYVSGNYDDPTAYARLRAHLERLDSSRGTRANRLFYLSVPPEAFGPITEQLRAAGLFHDANDPNHFSRVVVEKPLGTELSSFRTLDQRLHSVCDERQIYRIDHYLGKEAVQNLLAFRFANSIFEPLWNRAHIDHVQITAAEDIGVEGRGRFYETAGALRDIIQNHLMQVLSIVAMEPPSAFDAEAVRNEKVKVMAALRPMTAADVEQKTVRGQYDAGALGGSMLKSYREEPDVSPNSTVETYAAMRVEVDSWRWGGVPFYLRAGKRLTKRVTEVAVSFKQIPISLFGEAASHTQPNALVLRIQPDEGITLRFASKVPGQRMILRDVHMDFRYGTTYGQASPEAYERLLLEALCGDATLFARSDEVEKAWEFCDPILRGWAEKPPTDFPNYPSGSWGPTAAEQLLARHGRAWRRP